MYRFFGLTKFNYADDAANVAACVNSSKPLCVIVRFVFDDVQALCKDVEISKCHAISEEREWFDK